MRKPRKPLAVLVGSALAAGALYTGIASASGSQSPSSRSTQSGAAQKSTFKGVAKSAAKGGVRRSAAKGGAAEEPGGPDTDNIQQGDQSAPDTQTQANAAVGKATKAKSSEPGSETETDTENGPSDGPGGHADPAGNVDHQFEGVE
ncbi:hypothetical protein BH18ACT15_BH18ACT15_01420 [soil metagenome]